MGARVPISKSVRFEIFKRDGFICQYCGRHPPDVVLEPDHIVAVANGGTNDPANLATACFDCNRGKGAKPLSVAAAPLNFGSMADEVREREEQISGYREIMQARERRIEQDAFDVAAILLFAAPGATLQVDKLWLQSIKIFNARLDFYEVKAAAEIATSRVPFRYTPRFKYFCGICWAKIKEKHGSTSAAPREVL
jgi:hypothetical protein